MNYRLVKALNPHTPFRWLIVQNTPEAELENDLAMDHPNFEMVPGVTLSEEEKDNIYLHSFHHAKALNLAMALVDSDLVLILDPDCFLFLPNWIERITEHVKNEKIALFGTPYHPSAYRNYQGFPNAICMLINRAELNGATLDFTPQADHRWYKIPYFLAISDHLSWSRFYAFFFKETRRAPLKLTDAHIVLYAVLNKKYPRVFILASGDTGYQIYEKQRFSLKHHTLQIFVEDNRNLYEKCCDFLLPNSFRTYPRKASWIINKPSSLFENFTENGHQFFWKGELVAFHMQGTRYSEEEKIAFQKKIFQKIEQFLTPINQSF